MSASEADATDPASDAAEGGGGGTLSEETASVLNNRYYYWRFWAGRLHGQFPPTAPLIHCHVQSQPYLYIYITSVTVDPMVGRVA